MENREDILRLCGQSSCQYRENEPLKHYTSFRIGGPAAVMLFPKSTEEVAKAIRLLHGQCRLFVMGKGSNLLAADQGFDGVILLLGQDFSRIAVEGETLICEAGATMAKACQAALENGLTGLEFSWGIPGSVGGGAYMNAGAYGGEYKDVVAWCEHVDENGTIGRFSGEELEYRYRRSVYSGKNYCITKVALKLQKGDPAAIQAKMDDLLGRRKAKQPLEYPSAGSTFKRPEGAYAAALIEQCGLKGFRIGDAMVSEKHSGFLINAGNATCREVLELAAHVQQVVKEQTGFTLEREVQLLR